MAGRDLPTGTVTFLFTDIEGSTRLLQRLGEGYRAVQDAHAEILREAIAAGGGLEVRTEGDSFFAVFPAPAGSVPVAGPVRARARQHPGGPAVEHRVRSPGARLADRRRHLALLGTAGPLSEGREWLHELLAMPEAAALTPIRGRAVSAAGSLAYWSSDLDEAERWYLESLEIARSTGDAVALFDATNNLAYVPWLRGSIAGGRCSGSRWRWPGSWATSAGSPRRRAASPMRR